MIKDSITFHDNTSTTGNGSVYTVVNPAPSTVMMISIANVSGSRTLYFEGLGPTAGSYIALTGTNMSTNATGSLTSGTADELWKFSLAGLRNFRCRTTVLSGSITAIGQVIQEYR